MTKQISVTVDGVNYSGDAEKVWNAVRSSVDDGWAYDYNPFVQYYSQTEARRSGDGILSLADMPDAFLSNAFFKRFVDRLNSLADNRDIDSEQKLRWARDLTLFAQDIVNDSVILVGLVNEIQNRSRVVTKAYVTA